MNEKRKKMIAPIVVTVLLVLYFIVYFGFLIGLIHGVLRYLLIAVPLIFSVILIKVCIERIHEIKEGNEDDLSQY